MTGNERRLRSFVRRSGRKTRSQRRALDELWPIYGIDYAPAPVDLDECFGRRAERVLEIGFGNGDGLVAMAATQPGRDFIGVDVHEPGVGHCLTGIEHAGIDNLRIICHDAHDVLRDQLADGGLARINLYFPDPWPKKRHHKRRIVQPQFLALAARKLAAGGLLCIATDWANYAEAIDDTLAAASEFALRERRQHGGDAPLDRPNTRFERRGLARGHAIWDWQFARR